jgi:hypothetical protein
MDDLVDYCEFDEQSRFLDLGSGMGKPNFHAALAVKPALSIGVECRLTSYESSLTCLEKFCSDIVFPKESKIGLNFLQIDMSSTDLQSLVISNF